MKKIKMARGVTLTFEEGCNKYLEYCRHRNSREGTIGHYRQSYVQFYKFFDPKMPIEDLDEQIYQDYGLHWKQNENDNQFVVPILPDPYAFCYKKQFIRFASVDKTSTI